MRVSFDGQQSAHGSTPGSIDLATAVRVDPVALPFETMTSGNARSEVDFGWRDEYSVSSLDFVGPSKQRWADLPSSDGPSSDLDVVDDDNTNNMSPQCSEACTSRCRDLDLPPSFLGRLAFVGFKTGASDVCETELPTASSPGSGNSSAYPLASPVSDGMRGSQTPRLNGYVSGNAGIELRVSVPIEGGDNAEGATKQGYAGLLSMVNFSDASNCPSQHSAPFIKAVAGAVEHPDPVKRLVRSVANGMRAQQEPDVAREGMGGSYFLRNDAGKMSAIFKPCDEEPLAPNNPKGWEGRAMGAPGMKPSVRVGEAALREVAAYLLDHDGFAGVPPAVLARCWHPVLNYKVKVTKIESLMDLSQLHNASDSPMPHQVGSRGRRPLLPVLGAVDRRSQTLNPPSDEAAVADPALKLERPSLPTPSGIARALELEEMSRNSSFSELNAKRMPGAVLGQAKVGSLQQYVPHTCDANDMSPSRFTASNVHRIGILDLRIFNCDRHAGNLLVGKPKRESSASSLTGRLQQDMLQLIPIDHGFSLPEAIDNPYFEWLYWPQASMPFGEEELNYIANLNVKEDVALLRRFIPLLREECLRFLEVTTTILQLAAAAGLTLFEIGSMMTRNDSLGEEVPSDLEVMCMDAREAALSADAYVATATSGFSHLSPKSAQASLFPAGSVLEALDEEPEESIFQLEGETSGLGTKPSSDHLSLMFSDDGSNGGQSSSLFGSPTHRDHPTFLPRSLTTPMTDVCFDRRLNVAAASFDRPSAVLSLTGGLEDVRNRQKNTTRRMWHHKQVARGNARQVYPPLVAGGHPDLVNYVFSGLDDAQWLVFMTAVRDWCTEELDNGTWKQCIGNTAVAGSCPVFSELEAAQ